VATLRVLGRRAAGRALRLALRNAPFEVFRRRPDHLYVPNHYGRSAHKAFDIRELAVFGPLAGRTIADGRTLLHYDKLYTVFQAIENLSRRPTGRTGIVIADIGSFRGGGGHFMASCAQAVGIEMVELHCFDTFAGHQEADVRADLEPTQEAGRQAGRYRDVSAAEVQAYLSGFPHAMVHAGRIQDTAVEVESRCFDFAHVDVNLYEPTAFALSFLHDRLDPNGIIVVDDYGAVTNRGVHQAVAEFVQDHPGYVRFHLLSDQCLLIRWSDEAIR
jgi:hypothetical protein